MTVTQRTERSVAKVRSYDYASATVLPSKRWSRSEIILRNDLLNPWPWELFKENQHLEFIGKTDMQSLKSFYVYDVMWLMWLYRLSKSASLTFHSSINVYNQNQWDITCMHISSCTDYESSQDIT